MRIQKKTRMPRAKVREWAKYLFSLIVLLGVLAGCSNSSTKESTATATEPANSSQPAIPEIVPAPPPAVATSATARQGGHQVAQRFTNTFFPLNCDRSITWLLVFTIRNAGSAVAEIATAGGGAGTISGIAGCDELPDGNFPVSDIGDLVLMPGIIDPHVHINEPGRTEWEGFDTATKAAIAGGITTLVEMPLNASPVTTTAKSFDEKIKAATGYDQSGTVRPVLGKLHTNCGFWGGVIPGIEKEIEPLIEKGVLGFKAFLTHSGIDEFPNVTEKDLRKVMP